MKTLALTLLIISSLMLNACSSSDPAATEKTRVAMEMVQAWNDRDWDRMHDLFAEDGVLHSMMSEPITGRENIRERLSDLLAGIDHIELQILNMGVVGDVVVLERVDDFVFNGKPGRLPVVGVMEIADGKVTEWREYYDHAALEAAIQPDPKSEDELLAEVEIEIRALTEKLQVDWNSGDMGAYLDAYWNDDGLSLIFGGRVVRSWQALSDLFSSNWSTEEAMGDFKVVDIALRYQGPNIVIVSGGFEHEFPAEKVVGAFSQVWRRFEDGQWLIVNEVTSRAASH